MHWIFAKLVHRKKKLQQESDYSFFVEENLSSLGRQDVDWVENSFINFSDEEISSTNKNYLGKVLDNKKIFQFFVFVFVFVIILFSRSFYLQIVKAEYYQNIAEQNRIREYDMPAPRGIIYDAKSKPLVKNVPVFSIYLTMTNFENSKDLKELTLNWLKENLSDKADFDKNLEKTLGIKSNQKEYYEPILVADNVDYDKAIKMKIESLNYPGVLLQVTNQRQYLNNAGTMVTSLAHVLGYTGKVSEDEYDELKDKNYLFNDTIGKTGLEKIYENVLRGKYGKEEVEVNSMGKIIKIISQEEVEKGNNIYLSIDFDVQQKLENIMIDYMSRQGKTKAAAVAINPQNGQILALVSLPGYDNNLFAQTINNDDYANLLNDPDQPMFNRAISGEYPSGSTIKPVMAAAALAEGIVTPTTSFLSTGGIRIGEWFFPDWRAGGHGMTDVYHAIADSVNTYFYIIGGGYGDREGLGVYKIKEYLEKFGLNKITDIDLPNEKPGFLPTPEWKEALKNEPWYIGDTYHLSIGQGDLLATPLQIANYTAVFANHGILYQPKIVDKYYDQAKNEIIDLNSEIINQDFIDPDVIEVIRQAMKRTVTTGSARILNSLPVSSAAKTGTAQWHTEKDPHAWFTAFAPFDNAEIAITVLVEEGEEGSSITARIANDFLNWYFRQYKSNL